jgi:hypothetical protein
MWVSELNMMCCLSTGSRHIIKDVNCEACKFVTSTDRKFVLFFAPFGSSLTRRLSNGDCMQFSNNAIAKLACSCF